jgi:hypothetical protein
MVGTPVFALAGDYRPIFPAWLALVAAPGFESPRKGESQRIALAGSRWWIFLLGWLVACPKASAHHARGEASTLPLRAAAGGFPAPLGCRHKTSAVTRASVRPNQLSLDRLTLYRQPSARLAPYSG